VLDDVNGDGDLVRVHRVQLRQLEEFTGQVRRQFPALGLVRR
jgi:hypothetical protein